MLNFFSYLFCIFPIALAAQSVDSLNAARNVDSLILISRDFTAKVDYDKALEVNSEAENIALKVFGRNSVAYGNCMFNRGRINYFKRDFTASETWYLESISIRENVLGSEHPEYIRSKSNLAILYKNMGQYEKAERLFQETLDTRKKVLGNSHIDYATNLNNLANLYLEMGQYDTAINHFKESLAIINELLGKENEEYASILNNLAIAYLNMGRFENAEDLYKEALKICEKNLGKEHPDYAGTLNNLAIVYFNLGYYELAEDHYKETLIIREKVIGKEHSEYASSLNNLAILYYTMGLYEKAEPLSLESISILENIVGTEHPEYVSNLSNLAALYFDMGNYEKAEPLLQETKAVREKVLGKEHPDYAWSLDNLANLYYMQGKFSLAEDLYTEALMIRENQIGKDHPDYAASLHNLSSLHFTLGQYEKSETFSLNAKNVYEKVFGIDHPLYARTLKNLADNYFAAGQYERSERLFKDALSINLATFGLQHHEYIRNLKNLANLYEVQNRYTESEPLLDMYFKLTQSRLTQSATFLSERELTNYTNTYRVASSDLKSYLHSRVVNNQQTGSLTDLAYNQALFEKGFLLTAASRLNALTTSTTESQEIMKQLKGYRRRIAAEISKPITDRIGLDELEEKANNVEKELARMVAGYAEVVRQVKWEEVQANLPEHALAIEFVHYKVNPSENSDSIMYAALVIKHNTDQPDFIPLFEQREMDRLLNMEGTRQMDQLDNLYASGFRGMESEGKDRTPVYVRLGKDRKSIYDLVWKKIEASNLDGIRTIYYSPSGALHRLNLGAINIDEERILADKYQMIALNSTRSLILPFNIIPNQNDAMVIGGIEYEMKAVEPQPEERPHYASRSMEEYWSESGTRGGKWNHLSWTKAEADNIFQTLKASKFETRIWTGNAASEEAFKVIGTNGSSPRILHIATHGFFFSDSEQRSATPLMAEPVFKWSDNPMIRSGLILAGGNYAWQHGRAPHPDMEDGILTAYEISQMNLSNTELVVLSACETGLGDIQGNEGVYGLQRAFKIAGAKYLIMSLWQVPDRETMEFMTSFYKNWLEGKMTIPDAFRKTQREMRDRFINPYSWAGFVLVE